MPNPSIVFDDLPTLDPGQSVRVISHVDLFGDGFSLSELTAINIRNDTLGGGYFELNGQRLPDGVTIDFFRDASSISSPQTDFLISDFGNLYFVGASSTFTDRLVINGAFEGHGNIGSSYGSIETIAPVPEPEVTLIGASSTSMEEGGSITYTVGLTEAADAQISVQYELRGRGNSPIETGGAADLTVSAGSFVFSPGQTRASVTVYGVDDTLVEGTEQFSLVLTGVTGNASLGNADTFIGTLYDNDEEPPQPDPVSLSIQAISANVVEGDEGAQTEYIFSVTRSGDTSGSVSANWSLNHRDTNAFDFAGATGGQVTFAAGATTQNIHVLVNGDDDVEPDEGFTVSLSNPTNGAELGTSTSSVAWILNDDDEPEETGIPVILPFSSEAGAVTLAQSPGAGPVGTHQGYLFNSYDFLLDFGSDVLAVSDGVVVEVIDFVPNDDDDDPENGGGQGDPSRGPGGMGNLVTISHGNGAYYTTYAHLDGASISVEEGQEVTEGTIIGEVGRTGYRRGDHLHFQFGQHTVGYGSGQEGSATIADGRSTSTPTDFLIFHADGFSSPQEFVYGDIASLTGTNAGISPPDLGTGGGGGQEFTADSDEVTLSSSQTSFALEGSDTVLGTSSTDHIFGQGDDDILRGMRGADGLHGGEGNDTISGGGGRDMITGGQGNDVVRGGNAQDTAWGGAGDDKILGQKFSDFLSGDSGNDTLKGGAGRDTLNGGSGDDRLLGNTGADLLNGGVGNDTLLGGRGTDTFVFSSGIIGSDLVRDYRLGSDSLHLDDALWDENLTAEQVVQEFAELQGGNVVFDFGNGNTIVLENVNTLTDLYLDISII